MDNITRFYDPVNQKIITKKQFIEFQTDAKKYQLTLIASDEDMANKFPKDFLNYFLIKEVKRNLKKIENFKFAFSALSGVGKSYSNYILHRITKKSIVSIDLLIEMKIAKEIKKSPNLYKTRTDFVNSKKNNNEKGYDNWKEAEIEKIINKCNNDILLDLGSRDPCKPKIVECLEKNNIKLIYIDIPKEEYTKFNEDYKFRSDLNGLYEKGGKMAVKKHLGNVYDDRIESYQKSSYAKYTRKSLPLGLKPSEALLNSILSFLNEMSKSLINNNYNLKLFV
jgi:hypothetical protein